MEKLRVPAEFQAVFSQPLRSRSAFFTVLARPNEKEVARLGIVIAKRFIKKAVTRNRLRRLIRSNFPRQKQALAGLDLVVILRKGMDQPILGSNIDQLLNRQWQELLALWKKS